MTADPIVSRFYDAYNRHDAAAAVALYAEDGSHAEVATGGRREGRQALAAGLEGFLRMMPDACWTERERIVSGDHVAVVYTLSGHVVPRPRAPGGVEAPRPVRLSGLHVFRLDGDRIRETADYWDKAEFLRQIA